ncbi:PE domain-containing protein [Nocardia wallacei]|uniref:PE domain-containing protein n=1 Tax=Nocardia wallacei TaxID=480035 RepID=A0A7G1KPU6_9NOCA|nr:PE domain-containing protein [Nocardia wallacei]BCK57275.1 hypothetical protein NWFMUON74_50470 [Nocardia wallacei]
MYLQVDSDHLSSIGTRLGVNATAMMESMLAAAPSAVPFPPGLDDVSLLITQVLAPYAESVFGVTAQGIELGATGAVTLPVVGQSYSGSDILSGEAVQAKGAAIGP